MQQLVKHLVAQGFAKHFIAWKDDSELVSLRKLENFMYQYHVRIFKDGEVRGHYEYTPECHPIAHLKGMDQEHRPEAFAQFFGNLVTKNRR